MAINFATITRIYKTIGITTTSISIEFSVERLVQRVLRDLTIWPWITECHCCTVRASGKQVYCAGCCKL